MINFSLTTLERMYVDVALASHLAAYTHISPDDYLRYNKQHF